MDEAEVLRREKEIIARGFHVPGYEMTCHDCGTTFTAGHRGRQLCIDCGRKHLRRHRPKPSERPCAQCGEAFTPQRESGRFCSGRCRVSAHRQRHAST